MYFKTFLYRLYWNCTPTTFLFFFLTCNSCFLQHLKGQNKQAIYFERKSKHVFLCRSHEILPGLKSQLNDMSQIQPAEAKKTKKGKVQKL